jgi:hypothetical protein
MIYRIKINNTIHNLQIARDTLSHTKEMLSCSIPGKKLQKDKPKIPVIGDSFARAIARELVHNLGSTFVVIGHVKPGLGIKMITTQLIKTSLL